MPEIAVSPAVRIVVVDDHPAVRDALVRAVDALGTGFVTVGVAGSLEDARNRLAETPCDLLILDLQLPDGNGIELARELRSGRGSEPRILIVSASSAAPFAAAALRAGADGYLPKRRLAEDFGSAVRAVMRGEIYSS